MLQAQNMPYTVQVAYVSVDHRGQKHKRTQAMVLAQQPGERIASQPVVTIDRLPVEAVADLSLEPRAVVD